MGQNGDRSSQDRLPGHLIDLADIIRRVWFNRLFILKVTGCAFLLGLITAFVSPVKFQSSCKLMPESGQELGGLGSFGGLAGLAGIDINRSSGALTPELYPEFAQTAPFLLQLLNEPIPFESLDTVITSYDYFCNWDRPSLIELLREYTIGLPAKILSTFRASDDSGKSLKVGDLTRLSKRDSEIVETFRRSMNISVDRKTGIITLKVEFDDPYAAANLADVFVQQLTSEITNYKVGKAQQKLEFVEDRFEESRLQYEKKQKKLALFADRNKNINSSFVQTEYQRLQNEQNIAFEVYKGLATQLEQAKIQVKEETPVFTVLEPVRIPVEKSKPKRMLIVVIFTLLGIFIGLGVTYFQILVQSQNQ